MAALFCAGVDIAGSFIANPPTGVELIRGDLSYPDMLPELAGRTFDRISFLQSFGYAKDPVYTLRAARAMLNHDGFILLTRTCSTCSVRRDCGLRPPSSRTFPK